MFIQNLISGSQRQMGLVETCVLTALEVQEGLGRHQWDVPLANMRHLLKVH